MNSSVSQPQRIEWLTGFTIIRHEQRIEDDAIIFGSVIDGEWKPFCRMIFDGNKAAKAEAITALAEAARRST